MTQSNPGRSRVCKFGCGSFLTVLLAATLALSADDDGLRVGAQLQQATDDEFRGADSERTGGQEQRGLFHMQTELGADGGAVDGLGENRVDGDAGDGDAFGG